MKGRRLGRSVLRVELADRRGARLAITNHPNGGPVFSGGPAPIVADTSCALERLKEMDAWLSAVRRDSSHRSLAKKVIDDKPAAAGDACFDGVGTKLSDGLCPAGIVRVYGTPRTLAGDAITTDDNKCKLEPLKRGDYPRQGDLRRPAARAAAAFGELRLAGPTAPPPRRSPGRCPGRR